MYSRPTSAHISPAGNSPNGLGNTTVLCVGLVLISQVWDSRRWDWDSTSSAHFAISLFSAHLRVTLWSTFQVCARLSIPAAEPWATPLWHQSFPHCLIWLSLPSHDFPVSPVCMSAHALVFGS